MREEKKKTPEVTKMLEDITICLTLLCIKHAFLY